MACRPSATAIAMLLATASACAAAAPWQASSGDRARSGAGHRERLQSALHIDWQRFTLPNGLRVAVHTDRSQPVVRMQTIYRVGYVDEPPGKTGFAHLFEHLMFNGSENAPAAFMTYTGPMGADAGAVTDSDLTRFFVQTPVAGLERAMFLESDRMGWLRGAITPATLDQERRIVENEKRLKGVGPATEIQDRANAAIWGGDHGYGHSGFGSMADLQAASVADARAWHRDHYNPRDATIVLVGDIDVATAKRLVTRYFGGIPNNPAPAPIAHTIPTLPARIDDTTTQPIGHVELRRYWAVPGDDSPDIAALIVATRALSQPDGLLRRVLVDGERLFDDVAVTLTRHRFGSELAVIATPREGVDPARAGRRLDAVLAQAIAQGPTAADVDAVKTEALASNLQLLRQPDGRAAMLAHGLSLADDPDDDLKLTRAILAQTPASARTALARWTARPVYALTILPGTAQAASPMGASAEPAPADAEGTAGPAGQTAGEPDQAPPPHAPLGTRTLAMPPIGATVDAAFPAVRRATLSNGIPVAYVHDPAGVFTTIRLSFDAGTTSDPDGAIGLENMLLALYQTPQVDAQLGAIGATLTSRVSDDRSAFTLAVPSVELGTGAALLAGIVRDTRWSEAEVAAARAALADDASAPDMTLLLRTAMADPASPYGRSGAAAQAGGIATLDPAALAAAAARWIRPDKAAVFVVSSLPFDAVRAGLEDGLGRWTGTGPAGHRPVHPAAAAATPGVYLRNDLSNTSLVSIQGIQSVPAGIDPDDAATIVGMTILGGGTYGRISTNLRVRHQWVYDAGAILTRRAGHNAITIETAAEAMHAGDALAEIRRELRDIVAKRPVTEAEVRAVADQLSREAAAGATMPNGVLDALESDAGSGRIERDVSTRAARFRAVTQPQVEAALRALLRPHAFIWTLTGDVAAIRPQLKAIDLPVFSFPSAR